MSMRLLKKSEIDQIKAKDRQLEINEGLKIAKRVDALREVAAEEERSLTNFRIKTISLINEEINVEIFKRDSLKNEIKQLEESNSILKDKRIKLEAPLDLQEAWEEIKASESVIDDVKKIQDDRDREYSENNKKLQLDQKRVMNEHDNLQESMKIYSEKIKYASEAVIDVNKKKIEFEQYEKLKNKQIFSKESDINNREELSKIKENMLDKKEIELTNKEKFLEDRRKMLLRTEHRLYGNKENI